MLRWQRWGVKPPRQCNPAKARMKPRGNIRSASTKADWGLGSMVTVNVSESMINLVIYNRLKVLKSLNQKVSGRMPLFFAGDTRT